MDERELNVLKEELVRQYDEDEITEMNFINKMSKLAYEYACQELDYGKVKFFGIKVLIYSYMYSCWAAGRIARIFERFSGRKA